MIKIYTANYCSYCGEAVNILIQKGACFQVFDVTNDIEQRKLLTEETECDTLPQVFIDGVFIGGYPELQTLEELGQLDNLSKGENNV